MPESGNPQDEPTLRWRVRQLEELLSGREGLKSAVRQLERTVQELRNFYEGQATELRDTRIELRGTKRAMWAVASAITIAAVVGFFGIIQVVVLR
jgi:hypothetical protein